MVPSVSRAGFPHACPSPPTPSPGPRLPGARGSCPQTRRRGVKSLWKLRASTHITPESPCTNLHPGSSALSPGRSRQPCPVRAHESRGDPGEHPPCLLPLSPALHSWAPGATLDASAIWASYPTTCCPQGSQGHQRPWVLGPGRGRGEPGLPAVTAMALGLTAMVRPSAPSPALKVGSVWVQGKSARLGEGLKLSRDKPCPGRPCGFYREPDDTGNPAPIPGSAGPQGQVVVGRTQAPLSFLPGGTLHASSELYNPTRSVPEKTGRCSIYIERSVSF